MKTLSTFTTCKAINENTRNTAFYCTFITVARLGAPSALDPADLATSVSNERQLLNKESIRAGPSKARDPSMDFTSAITDSDLAALRAKFPFLKEFNDGFICSNKPDCIMRMETANVKLKEVERSEDADDRLAHNRSNIGVISVAMGLDDRTNVLHEGHSCPVQIAQRSSCG